MAKFLNTTGTNYHLEILIKEAVERLIIISPYLKFNDKIKELLEDRNRMKNIDIRLVYGKSELAPEEINWLQKLEFVRTSFCKNLHAKCYLNEKAAIITSMNLYDFSQINNNEMGVYILKDQESDLYRETLEEAQRLIRISDQVRLSAEKVKEPEEKEEEQERKDSSTSEYDKLTTSKLAKALGMKTAEFTDRLLAKGLLKRDGEQLILTDAGKKAGGEAKHSQKFGSYTIWPKNMKV
ncbi:MAG: phospholipase D family protein [bacterium]|nr:phospholipase D family protein [bacterium]